MQYDKSALRDCALMNDECRLLINREMEAPSPAMIADLARRAFSRALNAAVALKSSLEADTASGMAVLRFEDTSVCIVRLVCSPLEVHRAELTAAIERLSPGDIVILESLDLSKGHCFPYHSAYGRFQEILSQYQNVVGHPVTNEELNTLSGNCHGDSTILMGAPIRLMGRHKALPAMILEGIAPCLHEAGMLSAEEFDTVKAELRRIGRDNAVSMSSFTINRILYTI
jgi:hypothetical protein